VVKHAVAIWLLVVSTAPALCHEHSDGDVPHGHGLSLFSTLPVRDGSDNGLAPHSRHCHLVIFGIEIHVPACSDCLLHSLDRIKQNEYGSVLQANASPQDVSCAVPELVRDVAGALPASADTLPQDPPVSFSSDFESPPECHLCAVALGVRSGTQRT
jgi:hypothetical protein